MKTVAEALEELPQEPEQIAEFFRAKGIQGDRRIGCSCPIARWLKQECELGLVLVNRVFVNFRSPQKRTPQELMMPSGVRRFVQQFDEGLYPDLIDPKRVLSGLPETGLHLALDAEA